MIRLGHTEVVQEDQTSHHTCHQREEHAGQLQVSLGGSFT